MLEFLILHLFLLTGCLASGDDEEIRVLKGVPCTTVNMNLDYVVSILLQASFHCSGTLIKSNQVLTAATCINIFPASVYQVTLFRGSHGIMSIEGKSKFLHPLFNKLRYDVGVLVLALPAPGWFEPAHVIGKPIHGPMQEYCSEGLVPSWGFTDATGPGPKTLMCVKLPVVDLQECIHEISPFTLSDPVVCTFSPEGKNVNWGDYGSPLICTKTDEVIGLAIATWNSSAEAQPAAWTRLDATLSFINSIKYLDDNLPSRAATKAITLLYWIVVIVILL